MPVSAAYATVNVEHLSNDRASILNLYKRLIKIRQSSQTLRLGDYLAIETGHQTIFGYTRKFNNEHLLILLNFSRRSTKLSLSYGQGHVLIDTTNVENYPVDLTNFLLEANTGCLIRLSVAM